MTESAAHQLSWTQFGANIASAEAGVFDQVHCGQVWADSWVQSKACSGNGGNHTPACAYILVRCKADDKVTLACTVEEVQHNSRVPILLPIDPPDRDTMLVARQEDRQVTEAESIDVIKTL